MGDKCEILKEPNHEGFPLTPGFLYRRSSSAQVSHLDRESLEVPSGHLQA